MEIWLDTADFSLIEKAHQMGILFGVTTNPSMIASSGLELEELIEKVLKMQMGPLMVQVTSNEAGAMTQQGKALFQYNRRIIPKIPATAAGLQAIHALKKEGIATMATSIFDQNQALLAASAGASYLAPHYSSICESDLHGIESLKAMMRLMHRYKFTTKMLASCLNSSEQIKECTEMGMDGATINEKVFKDLVEDHPMTLQALNRFAKDWLKAKKRRSLPL